MTWPASLREGLRSVRSGDDLRTAASHAALERVLAASSTGLVLSIGGGPRRVDSRLTNLNIILATGVDVAASAYQLPFVDRSVAAVHCEAVLEHLEFPDLAVAEMFRVLRPGALVFAATPFLQPYHAHPDHFQNFTLSGHRRLFERAGFELVEAGTCVGPTFTLVDLTANYARELLPTRLLSRLAERAVRLTGRLLRLADLQLRDHPASSNVASSTFVLAIRPAVSA